MAKVATVDNRLAAHRRLVEAFADELEERDPDGRVLGGNADRAEILVRSVTARLFNGAVTPGMKVARIFRTYFDGKRATTWCFSSTSNPRAGRFDLVEPDGTCYFSDDVAGCRSAATDSRRRDPPRHAHRKTTDRAKSRQVAPDLTRGVPSDEKSTVRTRPMP